MSKTVHIRQVLTFVTELLQNYVLYDLKGVGIILAVLRTHYVDSSIIKSIFECNAFVHDTKEPVLK